MWICRDFRRKIETKGPSLDWSLIQPSLLNAPCDVAIILDCCYAGQAARSVSAQTMELLAATNKDQWTPTNNSSWQTFTQVLIKEMLKMLEKDKVVTFQGLARNLSAASSGLKRQPLHICLGLNHLAGPIKLASLPKPQDSPVSRADVREIDPIASLQLKLSLFEPLDPEKAAALIRWMTRDSPSSIEDIQYAEQALVEANETGHLCDKMLDSSLENDGQILSYLSKQGREEGLALLSHLRSAMSSPTSTSLTNVEALQVIRTVKQRSHDIILFVEDSLARLNTDTLQALGGGGVLKNINQELRNRINMRLTLITKNAPDLETGLVFDSKDPAREIQRFRGGCKDGKRMLVEYFYPEETSYDSEESILQQMRRISALHAEEKGPGFHSLQGAGFVRESLHGDRYGIIYQVPEEQTAKGFQCFTLSDLFTQLNTVPLETRMRTAWALCEALLNLHSIGWYHKAINSGNVLIFGQTREMDGESPTVEWLLDSPYLIGFDCSRPSAAETRSTVDFTTSKNIYRHPDRWGQTAPFQRHHDIYALVSPR